MIHHFPPGPGYWLEPCDGRILASLEQAVTRVIEQGGESAQGGLVGNLARQLWLEPPEGLEAWLLDRAREYSKDPSWEPVARPVKGTHPGAQRLSALWVNLQQPCEWNPAHDHAGLFSFVFWLQIPYRFDRELTMANSRSLMPTHGDFHFEYTDTLGRIRNHSLGADHRLQGWFCLFPAQMRHQVYPFLTTDKLRVTVSGNLE